MKAMIWTAYGPPDVLKLQDVAKPEPKDGELLIRVRATSVTAGDCEARGMSFPAYLSLPLRVYIGFTRPSRIKVLGQELSGVVEAVGSDVTGFRPGDAVLAATGFRFGGAAEYAVLPEKPGDSLVAHKPEGVSFEEAAVLPTGGLEALHFMRLGQVGPGQHLLINGAGGSIGTYGVQLAKLMGAEVTAVDSGPKLEMLRSIGADHVIDYTQEDFRQNGQTYDALLDVIGSVALDDALAALSPGGALLAANPSLAMRRSGGAARRAGKRVFTEAAGRDPADMAYLLELVEAGKLAPVIGRRFPLEQLADAHRFAESGGKTGNIVITVSEGA